MRYLSYRDMLTGLYNRNKYISIVKAAKDRYKCELYIDVMVESN
ncbi:MAG: hypothetical protein ACLT33_06475 [Lachnospira pectinoschiza]